MKQFAQVLIENFQSHERSEFHFGPGLNVIIGPSDNGKSAVLRAVRWALYNEPRGTDFVRVGARECRVTVTMNDGTGIVRELLLTKSGGVSRNRYLVTGPGGGEAQTFEGFGAEVPAEVQSAHGMPPVLLDTDKRVMLSFGAQLDGPFLLAETGSTRARAIGRLLGVHVVDAALRDTQRDLRNTRVEIGRAEKEAERLEAALAPYADLDDRERELAAAEAGLVEAEVLQARLDRLRAVRDRLEQADAAEIRLEADVVRLDSVDHAANLLRQAQSNLDKAHRLRSLAEALAGNAAAATRTTADLQAAEAALETGAAAYAKRLQALGFCPTCLQPVGEDAARHVLAELAATRPPQEG